MKKLFLVIATLFAISQSQSQTIVPGGVVSGIWPASGSPYLVQGAIMIANNSTLTIEPGVRVEFQGSYKFLVLGRLLAIGNAIDSITFTASNPSTGWLGIRFDNTQASNDSSKFYYCNFTNGKATASLPNNFGGAFYFDNFSKAIISNSLIKNCHANSNGGGIYCKNQSNIKISNNTIANNSADAHGGGIYLEWLSNAIVTNNLITNNIALVNGGGAYIHTSTPLFTNNIISANVAALNGGGIQCTSGIFKNNYIINNVSQASDGNYQNGGGGMIIFAQTNPLIITHNIISNNTSNNMGGGIYCYGASASIGEISNNIISNNLDTTNYGGGGVAFVYSDIPMNNNTISNNSAQTGGGILFYSSNPRVQNNILWGNRSVAAGNQVYFFDEPADPNFYNNDIEGGQGAFGVNSNVFYLGTYSNNINLDPQFNAPSAGSGTAFNGSTANWTLQQTSPCIDRGSIQNITYPTTDITGNPRLSGSSIDIGAYEVVLIGISEIFGAKKSIDIYPNPFQNEATIQSFDKLNCSSVTIYNMFGKEVKNIKTVAGETIKIQRDDLPAGVYILRLTNNNITFETGKFIIID